MSIHIKNEAEIEAMRKGGKILAQVLKSLEDYLQPGMTTMDLEKKAQELIDGFNVTPGFKGYHGYPACLCTSVNEEAVHTIPSNKKLNKGDIINVDCGVIYKGLYADSAIALVVGGETDPETQHFVDTTKKALWAGIKQVKPGNRVGDIGNAVQNVVEGAGYSIIKELTGHGIGYNLHEEPHVYNYGKKGKGPALKPGMVIAIEPITAMGSPRIVTLEDGWNIVMEDGKKALQHEHTVLVTETGYEVLTLREGEVPL